MIDGCFQCLNPTLASNFGGGGGTYNTKGLLGSVVYGATNHGPLNDTYPFAYGPHIGAAYQLNSKTVIRAGGSIAYSASPDNAYLSASVADFFTLGSPGQFLPAGNLTQGDPATLVAQDRSFPNFAIFPFPSTSAGCGMNSDLPCKNPASPFVTISK